MKQSSAHSLLIRSACALALGLAVIATPDLAVAQISVSITLAPPALPVYEQPALVEEGGIWAPGYWDYNEGGYFWVPGTWVQPPAVGLLWTPGYWGSGNGGYAWNAGYWGPTIGFYGGINYGFGYFGSGYEGGHWQGEHFYYNTAVSHVNVSNIHNTYTQTTVNNTTINRVSYNGGSGGISARPSAAEQAAAHAPHQGPTAVQVQHRQAAMAEPSLSAATNHGKPGIAATTKPGEFAAQGGMKSGAAGSAERAPEKAMPASAENRAMQKKAPPAAARAPEKVMPPAAEARTPERTAPPTAARAPMHATDLPVIARQPVPSTGQAEKDKANQQQQDELHDGQEKQRQELQTRQADDHARAAKEPTASSKGEELERQHQAQTQALAQRHTTEQNSLREAQASKPEPKHETPHDEKQP
jgi:WXXGXW repeat (2 copies)